MDARKVMLFSHDAQPHMVSGAEKALLLFAEACRKKRREVIWVSPKSGMSVDRAKHSGIETIVVPFPLLWNFIHDPSRLDEELNLLQQAAGSDLLHELITKHSPNLLVSNSIINGLPAFLGWDRKIPVWWYIHEVIPKLDGVKELLSVVHSHSQRILVPSEAVKKSIYREDGDCRTVVLLPYGVEIPSDSSILINRNKIRRQYEWAEDRVVVGWFGSLYPGKGLQELIRSALYLNRKESVVIVAAGNVIDPVYFQLCQEEASQISPVEFRYVGALPHVNEVLSAVDIVVIPSLVEEAFPNVALEAMAFGKSVVGYKSGGLKELIVHGETGLLLEKGDVLALGAAIDDLLHDPVKREKMGLLGRKRARKQYSMEQFTSSVAALLKAFK